MKVRGESLAVGGAIVCVVPGEEKGKKSFVPLLIPGELAEVSIIKDHGSFQEGKLLQILESSKDRVVPRCEAFGICGGCQLQHMSISKEREIKIEMIDSHFKRQTKLPPIQIINASHGLPEYQYRRRVTFHLSHDGLVGYLKGGTRAVVPIPACPIAETSIAAVIPTLRKMGEQLASFVKTLEVSQKNGLTFILFLRDGVVPFRLDAIRAELSALERLGKILIKTKKETVIWSKKNISPSGSDEGHFSQVNEAGNQRLHQVVFKDVVGAKSATELYAGSGNFTFEMAKTGIDVHAIEFDPQLVKAGTTQAKAEKLEKKVWFHEAPCEKWVRRNNLGELVIMDPPRAGAKDVIKLAHWGTVKKIIYISCSLPSFARDSEALVLQHGFTLREVHFVDMFPRTHHVELVGIFEK